MAFESGAVIYMIIYSFFTEFVDKVRNGTCTNFVIVHQTVRARLRVLHCLIASNTVSPDVRLPPAALELASMNR
ncbi:MAG: hypothetical protein OXR07_03700 [Nitrospira sp.]|nr:hypothetical protein [Nitrospira sp.]